MKSWFLFSVFCFIFKGDSGLAIPIISKQASTSPSVEISGAIVKQLYGNTGGMKSLNCFNLLNRRWSYPNGQSTAICSYTETLCLRHGLLQQFIIRKTEEVKKGASGINLEDLKKSLDLSTAVAELALTGCVAALEFAPTGASLLDQSGFGPNTRQ